MSNKERRSVKWWAVDDDQSVVLVTGYECPPNQDVWWVPELGYSLTVGHHLFPDKESAIAKARTLITEQIKFLNGQLAKLG